MATLHVIYVITEETSLVDAALRARPASFRPLLRAGELALYEWRPLPGWEEPR